MKRKILLIITLLMLGTICTAAESKESITTPITSAFTSESTLGTVWVRDSGEYKALAYQAYNSAKTSLKKIVYKRANRRKKLAVVLDLDETVLDNSAFAAWRVINHKIYNSHDWARWVNAKEATAVPGAIGFIKYAKRLGVTVFYVSNRKDNQTAATIENLKALGIPFANKKNIFIETTTSNKAPRLKLIRNKGYKIVMLFGDNLNDFDSTVYHKLNMDRKRHVDKMKKKYGTKFIVLPNPLYGGFDSGIVKGFYGLSTKQKMEARREVMNPWNGK